jgi:hypothetical protein
MTTVTRKNSPHIKVWVLPEEKETIELNARAVGLSTSTYLRNVGIGTQVRGVMDQHAVIELAKINGDLGRLGGLLKMWLSNDERLAIFKKDQVETSIKEALENIQKLQAEMLSAAKKL